MARYRHIQTHKVISSYGGVGSIIETPQGALIIEDFNRWPFFTNGLYESEEYHIKENRLLKRLQQKNCFPKLKELVRIPSNVGKYKNPAIPEDRNKTISAEYFPKWFYCSNCKRFRHIDDWWENWKKTLQKYKESNDKIRDLFFDAPKCYHCYDNAHQKTKKDGKRRRYYYELEQVRFILISPEGDIKDIPWERWPSAEKRVDKENSDNGTIILGFDKLCCENQDLRYIKSQKYYDLSGIRIECNNCKKRNTLAGLWGLRLPVQNKEKVFFKPVIRTSNSVYYPVSIRSIFLPVEREINPEDQKAIREWLEDGENINFIYKALRKKYSIEKIENFIKSGTSNEFESEVEYRLKEFRFIIRPGRIKYPDKDSDNKELIFERQNIAILKNLGFSNLTIIKRLKITTVQTAYTRQEPIDSDQFLSGEIENIKIKPKYTSKWGNQAEYLPAVESFGEGIFLAFDNEKLEKWLENSFININFVTRIHTIEENIKNNDLIKKTRFNSDRFLSKFILVHTLSHILIKEFEFIVGYPATSLNERLYVNENDMAGLLICTVAGSEGSYGGVISQGNEDKLSRILKSALVRAKDCASDPVCYNTIDGQGVGGLNMAACYSCALLPETSCEEFNSFLDRALLIDKEFGFFKNFVF